MSLKDFVFDADEAPAAAPKAERGGRASSGDEFRTGKLDAVRRIRNAASDEEALEGFSELIDLLTP